MPTAESIIGAIGVAVPGLGLPCIPGSIHGVEWSLHGGHANVASFSVHLVYNNSVTIRLADDLPGEARGWLWDVGSIPAGTARIEVLAHLDDGTHTLCGTGNWFTVNDNAAHTEAPLRHDGSVEKLIRTFPIPMPAPLPGPGPALGPGPVSTPPPSIFSITPSHLNATGLNPPTTITGANLPVNPFSYTVVTTEGLPLFGTGIQLDQQGSSSLASSVVLGIYIAPSVPAGNYLLRVATNGGTAQYPFSVASGQTATHIDYIDPGVIYIYGNGTTQTTLLIAGGSGLPVSSAAYSLVNAPSGITLGGLAFANPNSAGLNLVVSPMVPAGDYRFTLQAGTASGQIHLIKFGS